jgi:hypothetical protein
MFDPLKNSNSIIGRMANGWIVGYPSMHYRCSVNQSLRQRNKLRQNCQPFHAQRNADRGRRSNTVAAISAKTQGLRRTHRPVVKAVSAISISG